MFLDEIQEYASGKAFFLQRKLNHNFAKSNQPKSQLSLVHRKAFFLESQLSVSVYTYETISRSKKKTTESNNTL